LANSEIFPNLHRKTQYHEENENKQHHIYHEIARLYEHLGVEKRLADNGGHVIIDSPLLSSGMLFA